MTELVEVHLPNRRLIDRIRDMYSEDAGFSTDPDKLPGEASRISSAMQKYRDIKAVETRKLRELSLAAESLRFEVMRFYRDGVAKPTDPIAIMANQNQWPVPPGGKPTIKSDVKQWVDTNPDVIKYTLDIGDQNDILEFVDGIIKDLSATAVLITSTMKMVQHNNGSGY